MSKVHNFIRRDFTQVPNELIKANNISRDARFLFVYLCSKPDDWNFYNTVTCRELGCSDDSLRKYMKELKDKGWATSIQTKNSKGEFKGNDITLNPYPKLSASVDLPSHKVSASEDNGIRKNTGHNNTKHSSNTEKENNTEYSLFEVQQKNDLFVSFEVSLIKAGAEPKLVTDWLKVRKTKRATNTETAVNSFLKKVQESKRDINNVLFICVEKSWAGLEVKWLDNINKENTNGTHTGSTGKQAYEFSVDRVIETSANSN